METIAVRHRTEKLECLEKIHQLNDMYKSNVKYFSFITFSKKLSVRNNIHCSSLATVYQSQVLAHRKFYLLL